MGVVDELHREGKAKEEKKIKIWKGDETMIDERAERGVWTGRVETEQNMERLANQQLRTITLRIMSLNSKKSTRPS